jgi:hypothetical protein
MRHMLLIVGLAAGVGLSGGSAGAVPVSATALQETATATSPLQQAQYAETWSRRGGRIKCFREFVVGPYRCHWYPV